MTQEDLDKLAEIDCHNLMQSTGMIKMYPNQRDEALYKEGFNKALTLILAKREEFGHGYLKGKLLEWILNIK